jgi:O-antigen ligase
MPPSESYTPRLARPLPPQSPGRRSPSSVWEWAQIVLLIGNLGWTIACLGGFRAETMVVSSALTGALLVVNLAERVFDDKREVPTAFGFFGFHPAGWCFVPFLLYAAANVRWVTPVPWLGWRDWWGWAQMLAVFWVVLNGVKSSAGRSVVRGALIVFATVGSLAAIYQHFGDPTWLILDRLQAPTFIGRSSGTFGIPNSLAGLLILLIPPTIARVFERSAGATQRILFAYIGFLMVTALILTISRGAWLALAIVLVAWPLFSAGVSRGRRLGATVGIALVLGLLATVLFLKIPLVHERVTQLKIHSGERSRPVLWRGAWAIFREAPVFGGGAGSYNVLFDRHRPEELQDEPLWAHNDYLNTLSDYGAVGFLLFFGAAGGVCWHWAGTSRSRSAEHPDSDRWMTRATIVGLAAFALQLLVEFHLKIPGLAMAVAVTAALVTQASWPRRAHVPVVTSFTRFCVAMAALAVVSVTVTTWVPLYRSEALRQLTHKSLSRVSPRVDHVSLTPAQLESSQTLLRRAVALDPRNGSGWADLALADALQVHFQPNRAALLGHESESYADRALDCSGAVPEFWIRRGVARDLQGLHIAAGLDYVRALNLAPTKATIWYSQALHLSLPDGDLALASAAAAFALRLDPGNREAQELLKRLAARSRVP